MPNARLVGKGKNQKLVVDVEAPGKVEVTRDEKDELKLDFFPTKKVKEDENATTKKQRNTFFDESDESDEDGE